MLSERSAQRIVLGGWNAVSSNSRLVLTPASLTVLAKRVPTPTGPSVLLRISSTRGLKSLSFSPSARKAKTSSIGRSTTAVPWKRPPATGGLYGVAGFPFTTFASSSPSVAARPTTPGRRSTGGQGLALVVRGARRDAGHPGRQE